MSKTAIFRSFGTENYQQLRDAPIRDLHQGVVVFGGRGIGAENMLQPDPVVFFGVELVFDQVPFSATVVDHDGNALRCELGEIGNIGVKDRRGFGGDFPQQDDVGLVLA